MADRKVIEAIGERDPDGGSVKPTRQDYKAHENWARKTYGDKAWDAYRKAGRRD